VKEKLDGPESCVHPEGLRRFLGLFRKFRARVFWAGGFAGWVVR